MKNKLLNQMIEILESDANKVASCFDYSDLANKTIMITGASGLIGMNLLMSLLAISKYIEGIKVIALIHSKPTDLFNNISENKMVKLLIGDLTDDDFLDNLPFADIIFHSAGYGQPLIFAGNPIKALKINTYSTFKLFDKLNENGRFLFVSSTEIYSGIDSFKLSESQIGISNTNHPRACYIEGKRTGETICHLYQSELIKTVSVRLSQTYGPGLKIGDKRVLPTLIEKGFNGSIDLLDQGTAIRTYCYISDVIELLWFIILFGKKDLYNLGSNSSTSIKSLAMKIAEILNVNLSLAMTDNSIEGAPKNVCLDLSRLYDEYPKQNFLSLDEGLLKTIEWFKIIHQYNDLKRT